MNNNNITHIDNNNNTMQPQLHINLKDTEMVKCKSCGYPVFANGVVFRKVNKLVSGTTKDGLVPITVPYCIACNTIIDELLPGEIRDEYIAKTITNFREDNN